MICRLLGCRRLVVGADWLLPRSSFGGRGACSRLCGGCGGGNGNGRGWGRGIAMILGWDGRRESGRSV